MIGTRYLIVSCAIALCAIGCGSEDPSATEATEPEVASTTGAEAAPAPTEPSASATPAPAPEEPAPAAAVAAPPPEPPKSSVIVTHKVKDFAAWKTVFDADEPNRRAAGFMGHAIMTDSAEKPKTVSLWLPTNDLAKAEEFGKSKELAAKMKEAGVIGKPTMTYLNHVAMSPPNANGTMPKFGAMMDTKVKDFAAWKTVFDADDQRRKDAGIVGYAVSQDPKDPNHVTVWIEADDKDKLTTFLGAKELADKMKEAGVKGKPKATVVENGEMKMYQ